MKDNRNDRQYGQTSSGQQQNRGSQSNQGRMDEDRGSSGTMDDESYEQEDSDTFMGQQSRDSQFSQGTMGREGTSGSPMGGSARPMGTGDQQRSGEYSSDDDMDDLDEMDDDEITSSLDEEEDMDILDDDESNQMDQRGRQNY